MKPELKLDIQIGQVWGNFLIIQPIESRKSNSHRQFDVECIHCQAKSTKTAAYLNQYKEKNTRCNLCTGEKHYRYQGVGDLTGAKFSIIRSGAKRASGRLLEFTVSKEYLWQLFLKQQSRCALSGVELNLKQPITASLDRLIALKVTKAISKVMFNRFIRISIR